jgi:hypothetical protein
MGRTTKKHRNWRKYNRFRTRDKELMIKQLRREVQSMPNPFRSKQRKKGNYNGKKRGRPPKDHVSVIMSLLIKTIFREPYRGTYALLRSNKDLRELAGITDLPSYNTMNDYMGMLPTGYINQLIRRLYERDQKRIRNKKRAIQMSQPTQQASVSRLGNSGTAYAFVSE